MPGPWDKFQSQDAPAPSGPWSKFQTPAMEHPQIQSPASTELESAARGALQGGTFGFGDELEGAGRAIYNTVAGPSKLENILDEYRKQRDLARAANEKAKQDNPKSFIAGEVGGGLASTAIPGIGALGAAKGATTFARMGSAALGGAALGGLTGLGTSNADLTKGEVGDAAYDTARGAGVGAAVGGVVTPLAEGAISALTPQHLRDVAADRAVKATTGQNIAALRKIAGASSAGQDIGRTEESIRKTGKDIIDSGVIKPFDTVEDLAPKLAAQRQAVGSQIGEVGQAVDTAFPNAVSGKKIADDLRQYASSIPQTIQGKNLQSRIGAEADNLEQMGNMSFANAQALKNQFKYKPVDQDALISNQDVTNKIQKIISGEMEGAANTAAGSADEAGKNLINQYGDLKGQYRSFKLASDASSDRALKNLSNRYVSPSDYGMGATGAVLGSMAHGGHQALPIIAGVAAGALNKLARERGSSTAAYGLTKAAEAMENSPEFAQKFGSVLYDAVQRGGPALAVTHELLMKSDPDYKKTLTQGEAQ